MTEDHKVRFAEALARIAGDCELLVAMAAIVTEDAPAVLIELRDSIAAGNSGVAFATAHKLKGMLSTFETAGPIFEIEELMLYLKKGEMTEATASFSVLERSLVELLEEISSLVGSSERTRTTSD